MIVGRWPGYFRDLYGGSWPRSYVALDCETTGFSRDKDVIVEIGHCLVEDGEIVNELNLVLDWRNHAVVDDRWLRLRMDFVRGEMAKTGRKYSMSYQRMKDEGISPEKALTFYLELLTEMAGAGTLFVGHNVFFDEDMLAHSFAGFVGFQGRFAFEDNRIFDTAAIEKASQLADDHNAWPRPGDSLRSYFRRVNGLRKAGVRSNLDQHVLPKYRLIEKHGLDVAGVHGAGFDAKLVHFLMKEFEAQAQLPPPPPPTPSLAAAVRPTAAGTQRYRGVRYR